MLSTEVVVCIKSLSLRIRLTSQQPRHRTLLPWSHGQRTHTLESVSITGNIYVLSEFLHTDSIRLGALGFLSSTLGYEEGILNLGLHDQVFLLQWVQDNIGAFGGDKDDVTLLVHRQELNRFVFSLTVD